jgi:hypothetical protein
MLGCFLHPPFKFKLFPETWLAPSQKVGTAAESRFANRKSAEWSRRPSLILHSSRCHLGTFGRVLECWDREQKGYFAIKVIRNVQKYRDAAMIEVWILKITWSTCDRFLVRLLACYFLTLQCFFSSDWRAACNREGWLKREMVCFFLSIDSLPALENHSGRTPVRTQGHLTAIAFLPKLSTWNWFTHSAVDD